MKTGRRGENEESRKSLHWIQFNFMVMKTGGSSYGLCVATPHISMLPAICHHILQWAENNESFEICPKKKSKKWQTGGWKLEQIQLAELPIFAKNV